MARTVAADSATRERALQLAREVGAAEAARQLGLSANTVRTWMHRAGESRPPANADPQAWAEAKDQGAREAWETAQTALGRVRELLDAGKTGDAQRAALTFAILTDKSGVLETAAHVARERDVRLADAQVELTTEVLVRFFEACDLPWTSGSSATSRLFGQLIREATSEPDPEPDPGLVEAARAEIRAHVAGPLVQGEVVVPSSERELPRLPAPAPPHPDGQQAELAERGELARPVRKVRVERSASWRPQRGQAAVEEASDRAQRRDLIRFDSDGNPVNPESPC